MNKLKHLIVDYIRYFYYFLINYRFKFNMKRYRECDNKKDASVMKKEMSELRRYWGCIPMQYYTHDFYRKDCPLPLDEMKAYIPSYYFYFVLYPEYDNLKGACNVLENKITCSFVFRGMGLPTADLLAFKKGSSLYQANGKVIDSNELSDIISTTGCEKVFVKPVSGCGGKGIKILNISGNGVCSLGDTPFELSSLVKLDDDYVIESKIVQSSYLTEVYPFSVNTLRAVTCRHKNGGVSLIAVTLRMGCDGREVDNGSQGGLLIGIDLATGLPIRPYAGYEYGCEKKYQHPDTGFEFKNLEIKDWSNIKDKIVEFAEKMALYNLIGWDIALTDEGPIVIEANTKFGIDHSQSGVGGMRDLFIAGSPLDHNFQ